MGKCCSKFCRRCRKREPRASNNLDNVADNFNRNEKTPLVTSNYQQLHGSVDQITPVGPCTPGRSDSTPTSEFRYLRDGINYRKPPPRLDSVPTLQQTFRKVHDSYEIVLLNREKVDETLRNFKQALSVEDSNAHMVVCFTAWKRFLTNPEFVLKYENDEVKEITVFAINDQAQHLRMAISYINQLLIACHTFLNQYEYMRTSITDALKEARQATENIAQYLEYERVNHLERMSLIERVPRLFEEYNRIPGLLKYFYEDVTTILREITDTAYVLTQ